MSTPAEILSTDATASKYPLRFVTAASLFDGHDAAINIMRRLIQAQGVEVIHLGHNRSVEDVVRAALQEDADGIALSSYQGGHVEYFKYMIDMLKQHNAEHIRVFGGGGGTITPEEIEELQAYGVERIYHPNDGMQMGLVEMIQDLVARTHQHRRATVVPARVDIDNPNSIGQMLSALEEEHFSEQELNKLRKQWSLATPPVGAPAPVGAASAAIGGAPNQIAAKAAPTGDESTQHRATPVIGITGTGGAGKSSATDELLLRFMQYFPADFRVAVLAVDPTRRRTGGALLGDRIRMNSLRNHRLYMRSIATRRQHLATSAILGDSIAFLKSLGFDLVIVETAGIGQSDSEIVDLVDFPVYAMTSDFGAASQLEKIDMLDFAELVILNKYDRRGSEDALRDVRKQWKRNRLEFQMPDEQVPVYPTIASQFNDPGITWMFVNLCRLVSEKCGVAWTPDVDTTHKEPKAVALIPSDRKRHLAEIAEQGRVINTDIARQAEAATMAQHFYESLKALGDEVPEPFGLSPLGATNPVGAASAAMGGAESSATTPAPAGAASAAIGGAESSATTPAPVGAASAAIGGAESSATTPALVGAASAAMGGALSGDRSADLSPNEDASLIHLRQRYNEAIKSLTPEAIELLREWPARYQGVKADQFSYQIRGKDITGDNYRESLSGNKIPKLAPPESKDWGEQLKFLMRENLPGHYPYTGGVFPYRRVGEDPTRMFAGEGTPERTNRRFHYLSMDSDAKRLSTAFDSVTLYGEDPHTRPDIYGKVGNSGVSIATLDDMKKLYSGFDLVSPSTSVSMTINGPAPMILAFYMNTAIDQQVEKHLKSEGKWEDAQKKIAELHQGKSHPEYSGDLPKGNDGLGLGMLGITGDQLIDAATYETIKADTISKVRGTVQADILKEDQAQNTCIFSTEFALRMMGDIQQYFVDNNVRNFYSVSISGYHIAEAGANPISQLAFTLSNGFTIVEYYLARGMSIDEFAPNLSFFFSNGMDPEYTVIGRVARRIWARAMRERYGAGARAQKLKYHIQTSGRSLHAQEIQFNDIRTTLQALYALFDNCNSLHTNAYDEAITTPTEESVRRAVAIQMIITNELGLNFCENPWQGSYIVDQLTDLVEEQVYQEFERIAERGGVLGAMDTMYQRGKIQEESLFYESKKHDGSLPIIGVNTFKPKAGQEEDTGPIELIRSTEGEKQAQIASVEAYRGHHCAEAEKAAAKLKRVAGERKNTFVALMEAGKCCSLGEMSHALYEVGGEYRRNM